MLGGWVCNVLDSAIVISLIPLPRHEINHMKTEFFEAQMEGKTPSGTDGREVILSQPTMVTERAPVSANKAIPCVPCLFWQFFSASIYICKKLMIQCSFWKWIVFNLLDLSTQRHQLCWIASTTRTGIFSSNKYFELVYVKFARGTLG